RLYAGNIDDPNVGPAVIVLPMSIELDAGNGPIGGISQRNGIKMVTGGAVPDIRVVSHSSITTIVGKSPVQNWTRRDDVSQRRAGSIHRPGGRLTLSVNAIVQWEVGRRGAGRIDRGPNGRSNHGVE